ncbi:hypothetical protein PQR75_00845 [Paraburkholderia fungorum]|uniref:hypothetical protein n=1 Tax=Paraburkholderia fungorum TaxID=134537 RepID=UPI0038BB9B29
MTMLLLRTAVAPLKETESNGWFAIAGLGGIIDYDDAKFLVDDVTSGSSNVWIHLEGAKVRGLHDDDEVTQDDPRFSDESDVTNFAVVRSPKGDVYLAMTINVPEALLMQKAAFSQDGTSFVFG